LAARPYDRRVELPRVLPLWPHEIEDDTPQGRNRIISKLRRALRAERRRGIAGHWTYDLGRHVELLRLYRLELAASRSRNAARADSASGPTALRPSSPEEISPERAAASAAPQPERE
jgi:hypothetical protein